MASTEENNAIAMTDPEADPEDFNLDSDEEGGLRVDDEIYIPPPLKTIAQLDPNAPRLMITKISNENFKSYAGVQIVGPFHKCFSAVVGPNGSGKSNVIDSMLFVFGYRATKIRSKKLSVLIHSSKEHPNCTSCRVAVHFQRIVDQPGTDYEVVPNSEFVISRVAFKDNSSYYELNGKKVQFKEIAKILRSHGVDLDHNRFLILQGEVEQIAMMKPKGQNENDTGMLEFLEDIIGTVRYKEPLERLYDKVEVLTENRVQKLNRARMAEKEKAALEEPMQAAIQFLKIENQLATLQHTVFQCKRFNAKKAVEEQTNKVNELKNDISTLVNEMGDVQREKEERSNSMKEKSKAWEELQKQKDEVTAAFAKMQKKDETLNAELIETNKRRKANIASLKAEQAKVEDLQKALEKNERDKKECEQLLEVHTNSREKEEAALTTLMAGLKEKTEPLLEERSKLEKELISLRKNVDEAQSAFDIAQSELQLYTSLEQVEKEKLEKLKESLKTTAETLVERREQLTTLQTKIPATKQSLKKAQDELDQVKAEEVNCTSKLKQMRISFEEQKSAMHASRSRNKVLDSLMREKREGRLPGIFGRLGDLGAINGKYDVAISTACGPLDNIVVDTLDTARACITFLRQNDIGRATFIALEKQQHLAARCRHRIETPENVPRLFDLIKVEDERVLPAFYYGLQDTLVAQDLDQATRIAYGQRRYRVVTLKGELIELSGTMSGGGNTVFRGRMGQKVVANEPVAADIEKLQAELDTVFHECNRLRAQQSPLEERITTLEAALKDMTVDSRKFDIEVRTLKEQEPSLRKQLQVQEKKAADAVPNAEKVKQLTNAVETAKKRFDKVKEASEYVERDVTRINREIDEIAGGRVKDQQKKIANLNKSIDKAKNEICRLQVANKTAQRDLQKSEQRIETLRNDVQNCEQRLRTMQQEKQEIEERGKTILIEIEQYSERLTGRDEALASFKEEISALQERENKMKSVKIDLDQKHAESKKRLRELEALVPEYTRRIQELKLQAIPGETVVELKELSDEEIADVDEKEVSEQLQMAKRELPKDAPNMKCIAEYAEKDAEYVRRMQDLENITGQRNKMRDIYETARRRRIQEFRTGFVTITDKLKEMYQMITLGGDAELELVDSLDPFSEGVVFSVRPPKKSWKNICNLSGGEKTLSSLALVFALHHYKPTPLYFMDEIDAALDFKNVSIIGNYIKERTKNAQFIVISLRPNMFELADYLVGIYKTHNCTKCVTIDVEKFYNTHGIEPPTQLTSKTAYSTQMRRFAGSQSQKPKLSQDSTTTTATTTTTTQLMETELNLPDLALCPTPVRPQPSEPRFQASSTEKEATKDTVQEPEKEQDQNATIMPLRKRRKRI